MVTVRAASGDGASMHAQSPLDLVVQLSLQVLFLAYPALPCLSAAPHPKQYSVPWCH